MSDDISSRILIFIEPIAIIQDMSSSFNWIYTTWTQKVLPREEPQTIFVNGCMIDDSSCSSST